MVDSKSAVKGAPFVLFSDFQSGISNKPLVWMFMDEEGFCFASPFEILPAHIGIGQLYLRFPVKTPGYKPFPQPGGKAVGSVPVFPIQTSSSAVEHMIFIFHMSRFGGYVKIGIISQIFGAVYVEAVKFIIPMSAVFIAGTAVQIVNTCACNPAIVVIPVIPCLKSGVVVRNMVYIFIEELIPVDFGPDSIPVPGKTVSQQVYPVNRIQCMISPVQDGCHDGFPCAFHQSCLIVPVMGPFLLCPRLSRVYRYVRCIRPIRVIRFDRCLSVCYGTGDIIPSSAVRKIHLSHHFRC